MVSRAAIGLCVGVTVLTLVPPGCGTGPASGATPWVKGTFHGAGLTVTFEHPPFWRTQLSGHGFHYSATFAYMANFPLNKLWCGNPANSGACYWAQLAKFPANGVLLTFGTEGYGPGPSAGLGPGRSISISGRAARVQNGGACQLGVGSSRSLSYTVADGETQGVFYMSFCFAGPTYGQLQSQAQTVAQTLRLTPDPTLSG